MIAEAIEASSHQQAVARAAQRVGRYRVRSLEEPQASPMLFRIPTWGPPEEITE
ncbi:MAG: hypothetical protein JSU06_00610 [Actinobacteria bacterium]|nr:hypothetical protein [Actinomycetota bacterium]